MKIDLSMLGVRGEAVWRAVKKRGLLIAALLLGLLLLTLPKRGSASASAAPRLEIPAFSLAEEEKKLAQALSRLDGVGRVSVVLTLKSTVEQRIARDDSTRYKSLEQGYELQSESEAVKVQSGSGVQEALTLKYLYPEYKGALIIAENAPPALKLEITNAVSALTGLSSDKITVTSGR